MRARRPIWGWVSMTVTSRSKIRGSSCGKQISESYVNIYEASMLDNKEFTTEALPIFLGNLMGSTPKESRIS
jgi:hypothetical protein